MLGPERLFVSRDRGRWKVQWDGGRLVSRHNTADAAIKAARAAALRASPPGSCSAIIVEGSDGRYRTDWTYDIEASAPKE